jgi:hypothetical protein
MFRALSTLVGKPPPVLTTLVGKPPIALIPLVNHVDLISHRENCSSANEFFCPSEGGFFLCNRVGYVTPSYNESISPVSVTNLTTSNL